MLAINAFQLELVWRLKHIATISATIYKKWTKLYCTKLILPNVVFNPTLVNYIVKLTTSFLNLLHVMN